MSQQRDVHQPPDVLDELVAQLLSCGGVLSQMIGHMVEFEASHESDEGVAPIPEVAHSLIRSVLGPVETSYTKREIRVAARIVKQVTGRISEEIYMVSPEFLAEAQDADGNGSAE
jgi:hypothetical protein